MYYLIYQITNKINGKIYIGKHKTKNKNDDYMGSGTLIKRAIKKHGIDTFQKTVLFECSSEKEMNQKEVEIVNQEFIDSADTYNLTCGGHGSWEYINKNKLNPGWTYINNNKLNSGSAHFKLLIADAEYRKQFGNLIKEGIEQSKIKNPEMFATWHSGYKNGMFGKSHSVEAKQKMSLSAAGTKNHMYNKMYICNDFTKECVVIPKTDPIPEGWRKGRIIKK